MPYDPLKVRNLFPKRTSTVAPLIRSTGTRVIDRHGLHPAKPISRSQRHGTFSFVHRALKPYGVRAKPKLF